MSHRVKRLDPDQALRLGLPPVVSGFRQEIYAVEAQATSDRVYRVVTSIGGENGWYYMNWLWVLRGWIDRMLGGVGLRRPARPAEWRPGDLLDFWRVETVVPGCVFVLRADMILWGDGLLGFYLFPRSDRTLLIQRALYRPASWIGRLYWISVYPVHAQVFRGMAGAIAQRAESEPA